MAEEDAHAQKRMDDSDGEDAAPIVVPSHAPLPPPPEIHFTRPALGRDQPAPRPAFSSSDPTGQTPLSQGVQGYGLAVTAAITLAVTLFAFVALGQWLDRRFGHGGTPWFTILGLIIGVAAGFYNMIRLLSSTGRKK